ncbi:MAG: NAD-dependent methanol dehydrogenase [Luteibacter sp.]|uniref:iron-containing alcohol dehydrogenase PsrA n=1 Tax=Luteibacter sp. TaxID=1886636 RepID=UPI001383722F|nr:iron-containing alcohol dehydrogenase PsrA [Luteibacter sp.]KAF1005971.1 MAG: NAD-dependent methanol dehydrogenase [Luteibacter sp.]
MNGWAFHNPVRVRFGRDALDDIGDVLAGRTYVLVTYGEDPFPAFAQRIAAVAGPALVVYDSISPNPDVRLLEDLCTRLGTLDTMPEVIVALGGGSVMDSAKALAASHGDWQRVARRLADGTVQDVAALPIVAIPTTSGTGSEVTCWATVWDPEADRKLSLAGEDLYPQAVLVDPGLVAGLPWGVTLVSGLDALSHALESLWNVNANPITRGLAIQAIRDIRTGLRRLRQDLDDAEARDLMSLGSLRAGLAFSNTRTALAHNISYPVTLRHGVAHGIACSFCLPDVMTAAIGTDTQCDAALVEVFDDLQEAPERLRAFLQELGVDSNPSTYGIDNAQWRAIVADAFVGERGRNFIGHIDRFPFHDTARRCA